MNFLVMLNKCRMEVALFRPEMFSWATRFAKLLVAFYCAWVSVANEVAVAVRSIPHLRRKNYVFGKCGQEGVLRAVKVMRTFPSGALSLILIRKCGRCGVARRSAGAGGYGLVGSRNLAARTPRRTAGIYGRDTDRNSCYEGCYLIQPDLHV